MTNRDFFTINQFTPIEIENAVKNGFDLDAEFVPSIVKVVDIPAEKLRSLTLINNLSFKKLIIKCNSKQEMRTLLDDHFYLFKGDKMNFITKLEEIRKVFYLDQNVNSNSGFTPTVFVEFLQWIEEKKAALNNSPAIENNQNKEQLPDTPLKQLFKDGTKYDEVILLMIKQGLINQTSEGLQWHGYRPGAKYEPIAFFDVLSAKGLLMGKTDGYVVSILSGTFLGYKCSDRTARKTVEIYNARLKYDALLTAIK